MFLRVAREFRRSGIFCPRERLKDRRRNIIMDITGGVAVIEKDGKVLMIKQGKEKPLAGQWRHPGGEFLEGESPEEGIKREIMEEVGLEVELIDKEPVLVMESDYGDGMFGFFRARAVGGELKIDAGEVELAAWFPRSEILGLNLMGATRKFYETYLRVIQNERK
jgi:8-oxo-dGTP diphosphatase